MQTDRHAMVNDKYCLLVFVKYPDKGKVKSRLSKEFGEDTVLLLYEAFVLDVLETVNKGKYRFKICFHPPSAQEKIVSWLGKSYVYMPQDGSDLGVKMKNAFASTFSEGFEKVMLIGSDIPDLPKEIIDEAFASEGEAVIGPATDGGYYLIGFSRDTFSPRIFEGMQWSTESVFERTMEIFRKHSVKVHILPQWRDVDTPEDLRAFYERNRNTAVMHSRTMTFITKNMKKLCQDTPGLSW
jgi:rSAM/selenodomain-associated transferase 1